MNNNTHSHLRFKFFTLVFLLAFTSVIYTQPPTRPLLRIEGGMHTSQIRSISLDRENRFLAIGSYDKSVSVWDLYSGQLDKILRLPIDHGHEGKVYAVAISPDGNTIAVSGWTGYDWFRKSSIYLFDRESGKMVKRLSNLAGTIPVLQYSPNGEFLAAGLSHSSGIRLFETYQYRTVGVDFDSESSVNSLDFDPNSSRLVVGNKTGHLRLYQLEQKGSLRRIGKNRIKQKNLIFNISFSPDGENIAIGLVDLPASLVLSSHDLNFAYAPKPNERYRGDHSAVAWSTDGLKYYAAGKSFHKDGNMIWAWKQRGQGSVKKTFVSTSTIFRILPLQNGGLIYCSARDWGILDEDLKLKKKFEVASADFRSNPSGLMISDDGSEILYQYDKGGKHLTRFSIYNRQLEKGRKKGLNPAVTKADGLKVTGWRHTKFPKLNGEPIEFHYDEMSRSLAFTPNKNSFVNGMENHLRHIDSDGDELWRNGTEGIVWSVNTTKDGKFTVVAIGDGTIRWYRISDGQEVLAFYPHKDRKRWILWTPSGYYDASDGAEDLIGWQVNNGANKEADFFPNHLFRAQFYRPDVIDQILLSSNETSAVINANKKSGRKNEFYKVAEILPPVIEIDQQTVEESAGFVKIFYNIRNHSGEKITSIKAFLDGKEIKSFKDSKTLSSDKAEISLKVPKIKGELTIVAENRFTESLPAKVKIKSSSE